MNKLSRQIDIDLILETDQVEYLPFVIVGEKFDLGLFQKWLPFRGRLIIVRKRCFEHAWATELSKFAHRFVKEVWDIDCKHGIENVVEVINKDNLDPMEDVFRQLKVWIRFIVQLLRHELLLGALHYRG